MRPFFKQVFASIIGTITGLFLFISIGTGSLIALVLIAGSQNQQVAIKDKSVLVLDLSKAITDAQSPLSLAEALGNSENRPMTLINTIEAIDKAAADPKIVALFLDGSQGTYNNGYGTLKEIREALKNFRAKGKKIIAYGVSYSEKQYYLSSIAQEIYLNPSGGLELNGIASQPIFLTGALEKYGIGVQVIRVGKYKSAVEPYIRKNLSPENRQQLEALLNDFWQQYLTTIGTSRNLKTQELQQIADNVGFLNATSAQKAGLVDKIAYYDQVLSKLQEITGQTEANPNSIPKVDIAQYQNNQAQTPSANKIAVVYAEGEIVDGQGSSQQVGGDRFAEAIRKARLDDKVKAVVLRVNSPGGSAIASDLIWRELKLTSETKPVVVSMGDVAASGGYLIATAGQKIFAQENTITGSIGVFGVLFNLEKIAANNGITSDVVKTARLADINNNYREKTEGELKIYQTSVNEFYSLFLDKVAQGRKLPKDKVAEVAQGRVWSGKEAKQLGLVDEFGGIEAAIDYAAKQAKLGNDWQLQETPENTGFNGQIFGKLLKTELQQPTPLPQSLNQELQTVEKDLELLHVFNDPKKIYARLPFNLRFD